MKVYDIYRRCSVTVATTGNVSPYTNQMASDAAADLTRNLPSPRGGKPFRYEGCSGTWALKTHLLLHGVRKPEAPAGGALGQRDGPEDPSAARVFTKKSPPPAEHGSTARTGVHVRAAFR